ncbi:phosphotransferase [Jiangella alba]|uniref:phosphotransferase n=1 Tax=Jiangella alba TaxID=561176 RepID=UPI00083F4203|nr:phosphotransferase [Jiangella alba]
MLADADRLLAGRDPDVPGLAVLLDPDALTAWLGSRWDARDRPPPDAVTVRYLRYKPGTALVAAVELSWPGATRAGFVKAVAPGAAPKLAKLRGATVDDVRLLAYGDAADDRRLPGLARLGPGLRTLRYKPERRWVGVAGDRVVKVHRPPLPPSVVSDHQAVRAAGLPVPELLAARLRHGLVVYRWVDGEPLDRSPGGPDGAARRETGALLRRLHDCAVVPARTRPPHRLELAGAVRAVAAVLPEAAAPAVATARAITGALAGADRPVVPVHGDFSADQVIAGPDGLAVIDLDRFCADDPAADLAGWAAAEIVAGRAGPDDGAARVLGELLDGYRPAPALLDRLDPLTAAALLRRAAEPFRTRQADWPRQVAEHVRRAHRLVS